MLRDYVDIEELRFNNGFSHGDKRMLLS